MSKSNAGHWVKFFNASGIPSPAAATYAHIFVENRIQNDMILDLNKEYLREMGITPMGDIIAILRHAKSVSDQNAREKVLGTENAIPVAAITASPVPPPTKIALKTSSRSSNSNVSATAAIQPLPKMPRRVLPEHEGKYKIHLPTGTTERSKQILAKREKMYSDRVTSSKQRTDVFARLAAQKMDTNGAGDAEDVVSSSGSHESANNNVRVQVTGVRDAHIMKRSGSNGSSVFARLGGKSETAVAKQIRPILKNAIATKSSGGGGISHAAGGIVKAKSTTSIASVLRTQARPQQKVMLVTKVPLKRGNDPSDDSSCSDDGSDMDVDNIGQTNEKFVKFAATAEVREIAPISNYKRDKGNGSGGIAGNIKSRLGMVSKLHATKKTYSLKSSPIKTRISPVKGKTIRLKSDEILSRQDLSVHQRLGGGMHSKEVAYKQKNYYKSSFTAADQRNNYKIKRHASEAAAVGRDNVRRKLATSSVFDRLGFDNSI